MPSFSHLPLILKPDGKGKLSKRDGQSQNIPVFPLQWTEPGGEIYKGFKEEGYLPEAAVNFLAFLGWNPGHEKEIFSMQELIQEFRMDKIGKAGARFDIDKAKWFNENYLRSKPDQELSLELINLAKSRNISLSRDQSLAIVDLMKERVTFLSEMLDKTPFLFNKPSEFNEKVLRKKWNSSVLDPFIQLADTIENIEIKEPLMVFSTLEDILRPHNLSPGSMLQALRLAVTGEAGGPDLMKIIVFLGGKETAERIKWAVSNLSISD